MKSPYYKIILAAVSTGIIAGIINAILFNLTTQNNIIPKSINIPNSGIFVSELSIMISTILQVVLFGGLGSMLIKLFLKNSAPDMIIYAGIAFILFSFTSPFVLKDSLGANFNSVLIVFNIMHLIAGMIAIPALSKASRG